MKVEFLLLPLVLAIQRPPAAVVLCRGAFGVRQSVCDQFAAEVKDVVPSEIFDCTEPASPATFAALLKGQPTPDWVSMDFSSARTVSYSLSQLNCGRHIEVAYGDCEAQASFPRLDSETEYLVLIVLDEKAARSSLAMNRVVQDGSNRVEVFNPVKYIDMHALVDENFRRSLADGFIECQSGDDVCTVRFSTNIVSKDAFLAFDNLLPE